MYIYIYIYIYIERVRERKRERERERERQHRRAGGYRSYQVPAEGAIARSLAPRARIVEALGRDDDVRAAQHGPQRRAHGDHLVQCLGFGVSRCPEDAQVIRCSGCDAQVISLQMLR